MSCDHENTFSISGKTSDMNGWTFHSGLTGEGYVPDFMGTGSDYLELSVCVDCHQLLSFDEDAYNDAHAEAVRKQIHDAIFELNLTLDQIFESSVFAEDAIRETVDLLLNDGDVRYVTSEDCEVFDEGAMTADLDYEESQ
jgi:hypothetical protein